MRSIRGAEIAMIFQEPMTSFSPVHTVGNQIIEAIQLHQPVGGSEARDEDDRDAAPGGHRPRPSSGSISCATSSAAACASAP